MERLKRRSEFLRAAKSGLHASAPGLALQAYRRTEQTGADERPRVGFTTSRRIGNAVKRNRARRRLRVAAEQVLTGAALPSVDYVIIGRPATVDRPFPALIDDLSKAVARVHRRLANKNGRGHISKTGEADSRPLPAAAR